MRRADGLIVHSRPESQNVSRREFCAFACLGAAFLAACTDNDAGAIQTGGLNGSDGTMPPDGSSPPTDGNGGDSGTGATCAGTNTDVGLASSFITNKPKYFSSGNFFVVRDANGLYALTARCTHQGVTVSDTGTKFHCNAHGADFTYNGAVIDGPTSTALKHYAMCTLAGGHVAVQTQTVVSASTRLVA
jgi:Rieske Fe-S protein